MIKVTYNDNYALNSFKWVQIPTSQFKKIFTSIFKDSKPQFSMPTVKCDSNGNLSAMVLVHHTMKYRHLHPIAGIKRIYIIYSFYFSNCLPLVGLRPSSSVSAGRVVPLREGFEPLSATLAQDGLAECDQPGKNPLKYSAMAGNWTGIEPGPRREQTASEINWFSHWAVVYDVTAQNFAEQTLFSVSLFIIA